ncbi:thiolase family protein [Sphingomonas crocodyli]|uniref:Thiolase family protein n=1 Tax=Sphingomonas crocodyli TaxID=1979270 RepID=A0A437LWY4_9SPHN|nr:thiolase family protein [Sphingomonas crocodyli]RVT89886.1 thiolase family protein [Sphingomonas crocodyli]
MVDVVISGIGQSAVGRKVDRSGIAMTVDAVIAALADAGLDRKDIDGLSTYPGKLTGNLAHFSPVGTHELIEALKLRLDWYNGGGEGGAQQAGLLNAVAAIKAGYARHVIVFRTLKEGSGSLYWQQAAGPSAQRQRVGDRFEYLMPFDALTVINYVAMSMQRHFHLYGTTRRQLGAISVNGRTNAALNPAAIFRDPITIDDYLASRMISTPMCILDCDAPTDSSIAFILSNAEAARDLRSTPITIEAMAGALHSAASWDQTDMPHMGAHDAARQLWSRTALKPTDVDVAQLYDGFSFLTLTWLEALGFCGIGEGGAFVEGGHRIARDGELPLNTHGGQLSAGRTHGFGFVREAVIQLRREAGERQVPGDPQVAIASAGGGPQAGCMLLTRR